MARRAPKSQIVAFKAEEELATFLNKLPNKSAFIRKAIVAQLGMTWGISLSLASNGAILNLLIPVFSALLASRHFTQNRYPLLLNGLLLAEFYR